MNKNKTIQIWFCVNKKNKVQMFLEEPKRNKELGRFEGNAPFINSMIYDEICKYARNMNFESEPQCLPIQIQII